MDLASNTKDASEEIKLLKHVAQLIRSEVEHMGNGAGNGQLAAGSSHRDTLQR